MPSTRKAKYILEAEDRTKLALKNAEKSFDRFGRKVKSVSGLLAGVGVGLTFSAIISATKEQEAAMAQLEARLKSTGGVVGYTSAELEQFATELQGLTTFGDEAIISMEALLASFTNIRGEVFKDATKAILDMSVAMDQDLKTSALQVGKALNDPIAGINALSRAGVKFSKAQKEVIKNLVETGKTAEAQKILLQELQVEFGGSAVAARDTFGGALKGLQNAFGDLLEAKSGLNDAKDTIEGFTKLLSDPKTVAAFDSFASGIISIGTAAANQLVKIVSFTAAVWELAGVMSSTQGINYQADVESRENKERLRLLKLRYDITQRIFDLEQSGAAEHLKNQAKTELKAVEKALEDDGWVKGAGQTPVKQIALEVVGSGGGGKPVQSAVPKPKGKAKTSPFASALEGMQRQIGLLGTTTQYEKTLWETQNGRFKSLSENQKNALLDAAAALDVKTKTLATDALAAQKASEYADSQDQAAQAWRDLLNPMEEVDVQLEQLDRLLAEGRISWDTYAEGVFHTMDAMDEVPEKTQEVTNELSVFADEAARNMQSAFADFLFNPFDKGLDGMLRSFVDTLHRMASEALAASIFDSLIGNTGTGQTGLLQGFLGAVVGSFHEGGIVGQGGSKTMVNPLVFAGAQRYHSGGIAGLGPNEVPAILQRGEMVVPRDQVGAGGGAQSIRVNVLDERSNYGDFMQSSAGEKVIMKVLRRNSQSLKSVLA